MEGSPPLPADRGNDEPELTATERISHLAARHSSPLLALKAYAATLRTVGNRQVGEGAKHSEHSLLLADFVLRCNGFGLRALQEKPVSAAALEDYFHLALSSLLPVILTERTTEPPHRGSGTCCDSCGNQDEFRAGAGEGEESVGGAQRHSADVDVYLEDVQLLARRLDQVLQPQETSAAVRPTCSETEFILLSLTLSNWACAAMRCRLTGKAYSLLRCSAVARRCAALVASPSTVPLWSPERLSGAAGGEEQTTTPTAGEVYQSWFANSVVAVTTELNDAAQQLMLCNCSEALDGARRALLVLDSSSESASERFLGTLASLAAGVAEEYENPESALARYAAAAGGLEEEEAGLAAQSAGEATAYGRVSSLLADMQGRLGRFVTEAHHRSSALPAVSASAGATGGVGRGRVASTTTKSLAVPTTGATKKGGKRTKRGSNSTNTGGTGREMVLEAPPIDSALRTSIRRFGFPVAVFAVLPLKEALWLLVPESEELSARGWVSPFEGVEAGAHTIADGGPCMRNGGSLSVCAVMVCTETPLQWAIEAAALAANPPVLRYSVWASPPPFLRVGGQTGQRRFAAGADVAPTLLASASPAQPIGVEEPITRNRLARCLAFANRHETDEDFEDGAQTHFDRQLAAPKLGASGHVRKPHGSSSGEAPAGFLLASLGPPPPASALDGAKKDVASTVRLLSNRLTNLLKAEKAFENCWTATDRVRSALMSYYVPQQLAKLKAALLEKKRYQAAREDHCARVLTRFFRRVVQEKPRLQGFLTLHERRALEEEVAAVTLQKYVRRWVAMQVRKELEAKRERIVAAVTLVQSAYRRRKAAHRVETIRATQREADVRKGDAACVHFAAIQIQRVYRGHAERLRLWMATGQHQRALRHHLRDSRHYFATQIQKRVRGMLARQEYGTAVRARRWYGRNTYRAQVLTENSVTIQRYYRGYRVRRRLYDVARALEQRQEEQRHVGYYFKRYLGPNAVSATATTLHEKGGSGEVSLAVTAADALGAAASVSANCAAASVAAGDQLNRGTTTPSLSRANEAAVKIQSACRRWMAARRVEELLSARKAALAARRGETYKPFDADECVF